VGPDVDRNLRPRALVQWLRGAKRQDVALRLAVPLLLVRLDDPEGELAQALDQGMAAAGTVVEPGMGFHTVSVDRHAARKPSLPPSPSFGPEQLATRVVRAAHFVLPIGKRPDAAKPFAERVSVGRARNNDLVLRHVGVSKFHAWFGRDHEDAYYVSDASSHNGTFVNGVGLDGGAPVRVRDGDVIRFGGVDAIFCAAAILHAALRD